MASRITFGLRIPMRDGIELSARLYLPEGDEPVPVIVQLTPYISSGIHRPGKIFNTMGFGVLYADCRGRAESGGTFTYAGPAVGRDGADVIAWAVQQPWSNGQAFTRGGSAVGNIQWQILGENPPGLVAAAPFVAAKCGYDSERINNILRLDYLPWLAHVSGRTHNEEIYEDLDDFWAATYRQAYREHWPLKRLCGVLGDNIGMWEAVRTEQANPGFGDHWKALDLKPVQYARITQPILSVTGYYDGNLPGTLFRHRMHMEHGNAAATEKHFLVIGPWGHMEAQRATREVLGHQFAEASFVPREELYRDFCNWARGVGPRPAFLQGRIGWYVMGAEEWRWVDRFEDIAPYTHSFWLRSDGRANSLNAPGELSPDGPSGPPDLFTCDPMDMRTVDSERLDAPDLIAATDYIPLHGDDGVVFETAPLPYELELSGSPQLHLWLESSAPDFDLFVVVYEVFPDGTLFMLAETFWRARWRNSLEHEELMPVGIPAECPIGPLPFVSRLIGRGSRLRFVLRHKTNIMLHRNYNSGLPFPSETVADARVADIKVHHDARHPSRLTLPLSRPLQAT